MKIVVDQTKCRTVGTCVRELPQVFHFQEGSKKAAVTPKEIPRCLFERCLKVATHCPNGAIIINNE
jgi:ferredoxin